MKKFLFRILILAVFAAVAGCSSDEGGENPDIRFYAAPSSLNFDAGKSVLQLSVTTGTHWKITCDAEWLSAVPSEGTGSAKVGITAQANSQAGAAHVVADDRLRRCGAGRDSRFAEGERGRPDRSV